jgi:N-acyl-D-amino-acid deacylase
MKLSRRYRVGSGWRPPGPLDSLQSTVFHCASLLAMLVAFSFSLEPNCFAGGETNNPTSVAVEHGLRFLQAEAFQWKQSRSCAACHHAALMVWAFNEARTHGYSVDTNALSQVTAWAFTDMKTNSLTEQPPPRDVINLGWVYTLLSIETAPFPEQRNESGNTSADVLAAARQTLIQQIVKKQASDGSWGKPLDERVPLGGPVEDIAILSRLALIQSGDNSAEVTECMNKAAGWLASHHDPSSRQARNLRVLMNLREAKQTSEFSREIESIRAEQGSDGGWSQTPEMPSDAYATGQTLYVLARAGVNREDPAMKRGAEFLKRTQREEGSWPMTSRVKAKNLSPITATGTAWAVLGLIRASP